MKRGHQGVTYKDVAAHAGVSVATVSYVINEGPRPVSSEARARVQAAIQALGYHPNELARGLRRKQSSTIGLLIPNITNSFYAEMAHELQTYCHRHGFLVLLCDSDGVRKREEQYVQALRSKQVEGLVAIPYSDPEELLRPVVEAGIPVVLLEHEMTDVPCIKIDEFRGGQLSTQYLIGLGHRRIALLRQRPTSALSSRRVDGYRQALKDAGLPYDPALVFECDSSQEAGYRVMRQLLLRGHPPTAVFAHNDLLAMGVCHAVRQAGLSVPEDVSVVGYDDISSAGYLNPPLTTVRFPKAEMGRLAGEMIVRMVGGDTQIDTLTLKVELVIRASAAAPRWVASP
ncbi:LacI family DNA-binding transcriptional regulator [Deinococcus sp.]|uniref:LacI family DNA-binding transcriptional regulator n=1 Tax=Deinococcus sp. TaxID=47478 RepID=UPI003CC5BD84